MNAKESASLFLLAGCAAAFVAVFSRGETKAFVVTAYCPASCCCGSFADGVTASGHIIQPGDKFVAAPPEYAFGTVIYIPGYGKVKVRDRGGAIKGDRLDIYLPTHKEALQWGRRTLVCKVY